MWWDLNSLQKRPNKVGDLYLGAMLAQLRTEGYSIFIVRGECALCRALQRTRRNSHHKCSAHASGKLPALLPAKSAGDPRNWHTVTSLMTQPPARTRPRGRMTEAQQLAKAMAASLADGAGAGGGGTSVRPAPGSCYSVSARMRVS